MNKIITLALAVALVAAPASVTCNDRSYGQLCRETVAQVQAKSQELGHKAAEKVRNNKKKAAAGTVAFVAATFVLGAAYLFSGNGPSSKTRRRFSAWSQPFSRGASNVDYRKYKPEYKPEAVWSGDAKNSK